jgi:threonine dehydrogenase-like Zn-dependent dehydrogenase
VKALVFTGPGSVEMQDVPEPEPADGDVLVHVRAVGICGSELHGARHPGFRKPPLIMGHEFAGMSAAGDRVVINPMLSCGHCELCRGGLRQVCRERQIIGVHRAGGFAERVAVPGSTLRTLPDWLSWEAAAMIEPAANAVHAWNLARAGTGTKAGAGTRAGADAGTGARVAVLGCGAIGLLCLLTALDGGAASVDVTDLDPGRLAQARQLGAAAAGPGLDGEYDVIFDAVGSPVTRATSVTHQRPGGTAVWLGLADEAAGFDGNALIRAEKRVQGSFAYSDEEFARAAELLRGWDLSWTTPYPLTEGAEIFTGLMNGGLEPVKALLVP